MKGLKRNDLDPLSLDMRIPQILHFAWLTSIALPSEANECLCSWQEAHKDWKVIFWTEENRPVLENEELYLEAADPVERNNILRYEILRIFGGVYIDAYLECLQPISILIAADECFTAMREDDLASCSLIGCVPDHPLVIDAIQQLKKDSETLPQSVSTSLKNGSHFFTRVLSRHTQVTRYHHSVFCPYGTDQPWLKFHLHTGAYAVHRWGSLVELKNEHRFVRGRTSERPLVSVVMLPSVQSDCMRLEWALEALCQQTEQSFEVLLLPTVDEAKIKLIQSFDLRLRCSVIDEWAGGPYAVDRLMSRANGKRLLFLTENCVADPHLLAQHALQSNISFLSWSSTRKVPKGIVFPHRRGYELDYEFLWRNSEAAIYSDHLGFKEQWDSVESQPISASKEFINQYGAQFELDQQSVENMVRLCYSEIGGKPMRHHGPSSTLLETTDDAEQQLGVYWLPPLT